MSKSPVPTKNPTRKDASKSIGKGDKGTFKISREEVEQAFAFFDESGTGVLKPKDLHARLKPFYPQMTMKDCRFLISEPNFTVDTLWSLLEENTITDFDPVEEAFRVYDPKGTGFVDIDTLTRIMEEMKYGKMTKEDLEVLVRTADMNGDGKISLDDFRKMLSTKTGTSGLTV